MQAGLKQDLSVWALALGAGLALPAVQAAEAFEDSVPLETVRAFLGMGDDPDAHLYRDLAPDFPLQALPGGVEVLGSVTRQGSTTLYLRSAEADEGLLDDLSQSLEDAGWQPRTLPGARNASTGFISLEAPRYPRIFCQASSGYLQMNSERGSTGLLLRLIWNDGETSAGLCGSQTPSAPPTPRAGLIADMPRLELPREADLGGRGPGPTGGYTQNNGSARTSTWLDVDWAPEELRDHFAAQMEAQGWRLAELWSGEAVAGSLWRREAEDRDLLAQLTVLRKQGSDYHLDLQVLDPAERR